MTLCVKQEKKVKFQDEVKSESKIIHMQIV